ncbi:hypothetical protein DNH61_02085 [Paenibacillus sambharensis]|uniref:Uncharacterized protein n=1 Tax=Paenibacillus sambharensis TaxID=1803190 RepID=A0A2W1LSL3_9BACL|nr:CBO0543 family protein [Paenibacillus sambharensis]PZD97484.1 hypothetical protein DNH61_02085 [Paenibacillus sambharensis]
MRPEHYILIYAWIFSLLLLWLVPRDKIRPAITAFLFMQMITYVMGLVVVEQGLIVYPVREVPDSNRASLTYEFMAFPTVSALFVSRFPTSSSLLCRCLYYIIYSSVLTSAEALLEAHTNVIHYIHWRWWLTWSSLLVSLWLTNLFCKWFFDGYPEGKAG